MGAEFTYATLRDKALIESVPVADRMTATSVYDLLGQTAAKHGARPAITFQIKSGPDDKAVTLTWADTHAQVTQAANLFRALGVGPDDVVAYLLPNCNETAIALLGAATAGIVAPVNPLLDVEQTGAILREAGAKVLITLAPFPKTDVAEKAHAAAALAPGIKTILHVDLKRYLTPPLSWIVPLLRPRLTPAPQAKVLDFNSALAGQPADRLTFDPGTDLDRVAAYFHTGGTTGMPKIAQHQQRGMIYNGLVPHLSLFTEEDVLICPLPLFHVFAAYPVLMSCVHAGSHMVMPTPAGFRGDGVMDNFWKLIERHGVTFMAMVPTAASALMQRKVDADLSSLRYAFCGSAPLPVALFNQFEEATGVKILEGYGMTEATCLVSINPPHGDKKIGSVGLPFAYTDVRILDCDASGTILKHCETNEIGEICIASPGVFPGYRDPTRNAGLFAGDNRHVRTGDLGKLDEDGYLWITGRAKDLIIRGGHNIDPAVIEEALSHHPSVALVGAVGQPDAHSGEVACAYVELIEGAIISDDELLDFAAAEISERAAIPKHIEIVDELPKTAVGKVFKPDLRKSAIARVYRRALNDVGIDAEIQVIEDKARGLVAEVIPKTPGVDAEAIGAVLGAYPRPWDLSLSDR